jgi:peptidoglycan/LPS O-acetylase OafA/YrhL
MSFSFYLLNVPVPNLIWAFTDRWTWASQYALELGLCVGLLSVALTWPLAVASERWIERPAIAPDA